MFAALAAAAALFPTPVVSASTALASFTSVPHPARPERSVERSRNASAHLERSVERSRDAQSRDAQTAQASKQPNGWRYEEPGNACQATRTLGTAHITLRLTRWNDLSDSILFHRPGLPPLWSEDGYPTGRSEAEEEADAEANYRLEVRIDGRPIETVNAFTAMLLDHGGRPGPTYRIGIRQQPFIRRLRTGRILEIRHRGRRLAAIPIRGSATIARRMARCVDLPVR